MKKHYFIILSWIYKRFQCTRIWFQSKEIASAPELFLHQTWFPDQNVITEHITTIKDKSAL
jgi:hypothetical protein